MITFHVSGRMLEYNASISVILASNQVMWNVLKLHKHAHCACDHDMIIVIGLTCYLKGWISIINQNLYRFRVRNMSKCLRRNISCWQYWISWTTFVKIYYYTQNTSCQFKYSCDIVIGLTCSWAWSIGPTRSPPPPLCVLTSLIAEGRRGAEPVSLSFFLSLRSFLSSSLYPFPCLLSLMTNLAVSGSCCGRLWMLCMWLNDTQCFSPWKHLFLSSECFIREAQSLIGDNV